MRNNNHILNQFFFIYFNIHNSLKTHLSSLKSDILMTLTLSVILNISDVEFVKQIISLLSISDKYDIFMILIMKQDSFSFILMNLTEMF